MSFFYISVLIKQLLSKHFKINGNLLPASAARPVTLFLKIHVSSSAVQA